MEQNRTFKAIDLLDMILDFIEMTPDEREWNLRSLDNNKSRYIRLQRIQSLLKAFNLLDSNRNIIAKTKNWFNGDSREQINSVLSGEFMEKREINDYRELLDFAQRFMLERGYPIDLFMPVNHVNSLEFIYPKMVQYKQKLRELIRFNFGWLEASGLFSNFHIILTNSISSNLVDKYDDLDSVLEMFLNPYKLTFREDELVSKYDYPTDDLRAIDIENI